MYSLAIARFDIPGEAGFPLNGNYIFIVHNYTYYDKLCKF